MTTLFATHALLPTGWAGNVEVTFEEGAITKVEAGAAPSADAMRVEILLPAIANLHSHTFQRAFAGMTETRGANRESFWTWRETMYRFLDVLRPEHIEAIAALAFMEMLESGFSAVAEFHYVHHQRDGAPYAERGELSARIFAAALETGIGLTHLPVLYSFGGAGEMPLAGGQFRFGNTPAEYQSLHEELVALARRSMPHDARVGFAPHSLRATSPHHLLDLASRHANGPIHIHVAEQPKEVADVTQWLGSRPVQWLLDNLQISANWCLVHATHMTEAEVHGLAASGAVAGLCPITESNLGDGVFEGRKFLAAGGAFGIGTDSNVRISLAEELGTLEYSQRLKHMERNVLAINEGSTGEQLYRMALKGGAQALCRKSGQIAQGYLADLVSLDTDNPALCALRPEQLMDGWVFASVASPVADVWSAGRHKVHEGRHVKRDAIATRYRETMRELAHQL